MEPPNNSRAESTNSLLAPNQLLQGASFSSTTNPRTLRNVTIEVRNYLSEITLQHPTTFLKSGYVINKPLPVLGCSVERCVFSKSPASLRGTEGLLSYEIQLSSPKNKPTFIPGIFGQGPTSSGNNNPVREKYTLNIMWSAPIFFPYWQGVGVSSGEDGRLRKDIYERMYSGQGNGTLFSRTTALHTISHDATVWGLPISVRSRISDEDDAELVVEIR